MITFLVTLTSALVFLILNKVYKNKDLYLHVPVFILFGASIMWFVDLVFKLISEGVIINQTESEWVSDIVLSCIILIATVIVWLTILFIKRKKNIN